MTSKHAPSPWKFDGEDVISADGRLIAGVQFYGNGRQRETTENLFLAAPVMYQALKEAKEVIANLHPGFEVYQKILDAIAKAEGQFACHTI